MTIDRWKASGILKLRCGPGIPIPSLALILLNFEFKLIKPPASSEQQHIEPSDKMCTDSAQERGGAPENRESAASTAPETQQVIKVFHETLVASTTPTSRTRDNEGFTDLAARKPCPDACLQRCCI
jgi:hypothetical protein